MLIRKINDILVTRRAMNWNINRGAKIYNPKIRR